MPSNARQDPPRSRKFGFGGLLSPGKDKQPAVSAKDRKHVPRNPKPNVVVLGRDDRRPGLFPSVSHPYGNSNQLYSTSALELRPTRSMPQQSYQNATQPSPLWNDDETTLRDSISTRMSAMINAIDLDQYPDDEHSLVPPLNHSTSTINLSRNIPNVHSVQTRGQTPIPFHQYFAKVYYYANSRLPPALPPLKLYIPTWPLLCLAAQHSLAVYSPTPPPTASRTTLAIPASTFHGTKAMTLTTTTVDTSATIVLAIRGSASFADWAVNFRPAPASPTNFLDDPGNLCHAGFLGVARAMLTPIAARLTTLLNHRDLSKTSLLLTGHSAGGAVAALLYAHALSTDPSIRSPLKDLASALKRVHCVIFGAPPVTLLPLQKPSAPTGPRRKSLFFAFVNEGDPVTRAEVAYTKSLLALMAASPPSLDARQRLPVWRVPDAVLSCAGRLVLLRDSGMTSSGDGMRGIGSRRKNEPDLVQGNGVEALMIDDAMLRGVVFGDPLMHGMRLYAKRIEGLAVGAVTGGVRVS